MSSEDVSTFTAIKDQAVGVIKETFGSLTGNQKMELVGKAQKIHGKNEYDFAQAHKHGESEPEKFRHAYHEIPQDPAEGKVEGEEPSMISAKTDQFLGGVKDSIGSATGNQNMELLGKAQKVHGRNEAEFAKAERQGLHEPEHFVQGTKTTDHAEGTVEGDKASSLSAMKDRTIGAIKETIGSTTGNQNMELLGKAQRVHGRNEAEFAKAERQGLSEPEQFAQGTKTSEHAEGKVEGEKPSTVSSLKDRALGSVKETLGSVTGNQTMELIGKAQNVHGRNEAEFAKAQSQGMQEPEHFIQGTKTCDHAEGTVESDSSSIGGFKDRAVGAMKETMGSITGNQKMELIGKAQNVHGRNEAEFAKAERCGETEPQHFACGTKSFDQAEGTVEGDKPSTMSAIKDRTVGAVKEGLGSAMGDQKMELIGKAQNVHGRNEAEFAKAEKQGLSQPQHFDNGSHDIPLAHGSVEESSPSTFSALKDQAVGSVKESLGSATGDQHMELIGKAQKIHGRNEAELAREGQQA